MKCGTTSPVDAAAIHVTIDQGAAPGPYATIFSTDAAGKFDVRIPDYGDSWITFTFDKAGLSPLSNQFKGSTTAPAELCMTPMVSP